MKLQFKKCFQNLSTTKIGGCVLALIFVMGMISFVWSQNDVTLVIDGKTTYSKTFASSVKTLLVQNNIPCDPTKDKVEPSLSTKIEDGSKIVLRHGRPIIIELNGKRVKVYTTALTVGNALREASVKTSSGDTVIPGKARKIASNMRIVVRYTSKTVEIAQTPISFRIIEQNDSSLEKGQQKIVTQGKEGQLLSIYEAFSSGEKKLIGNRLLCPPTNQVVRIGIKEPPPRPKPGSTVVASIGVSRGGGRTMSMVATAYAPGHGCGTITASGRRAGLGIVAVDPRVIPMGSRVNISGYGTAIAADTGGAIKGNRIDVCFNSVSEARAWGRRRVTVTIY